MIANVTTQPGIELGLVDAMPRTTGPILVASDGASDADAAFIAAREISRRDGTRVEVVSVLENMPIVTPDFGLVPPPLALDEERKKVLADRVAYQINTFADGEGWLSEVKYGQPARVIARTARESRARMIVMGLGHHGLIERLAGSETSLQVARLTDTPILAVTPDFDSLPRRVLIATDFSPTSIRAARVALTLVPDYATIYLAHVKPRLPVAAPGWEMWGVTYESSLPPAFERLRAALGIPSEYSVENVILRGDPVKEILDFARAAEVELIACGSQGHDFLERLLVGSVATGLLRAARCSVMVASMRSGDIGASSGEGALRIIADPAEWAPRLEEVTTRNGGRRATLETDDPELGAQAQGLDYPFLGAAYDRRDGRVELMFGDERGTQHLTRSIGGISGMDILVAPDGRDQVLRITHGKGQTLLTFTQ